MAAGDDAAAPEAPAAGQSVAVAAEALYLANLLVLPGLAFVALAVLAWRHRATPHALARNHLRQALWVSTLGGALIALAVAAVAVGISLGHRLPPSTLWTVLILYFTCIHSTLVVFGSLGLARAMAGQSWRYPLIGPRLLP